MRDFVTAAEEPSSSQVSSTLFGTVAVVDMVEYAAIAKLLEQNLGSQAVAKLNRQIQDFIAQSLHQLPDPQAYRIIAKTGDGAIVFFQHTEDAHQFGRGVHLSAHAHNGQRSESKAERWFRIGVATGEVNVTSAEDQPCEFAGITIANAVRLETSAEAGEIVADVDTFGKLSPETQKLYGAEEVVRGKREETFRARKCRVTQKAEKYDAAYFKRFTRRRALRLSSAACATAAGAFWLEWPRIEQMINPLPAKRFVALMAWPAADLESAPLVESVLTSIHTRVRRAERSIHDLVVLNTSDMSQGNGVADKAHTPMEPKKLASLWGATLVLTASLEKQANASLLHLKLLDAQFSKTLRSQSISIQPSSYETANETASRSAEQMLELPQQSGHLTDDEELSGVPPPAQQLLRQAQALDKKPNDGGLAEAIETYLDAVNKYPTFALAYAELGKAYFRQFANTYDIEYIKLAEKNLTLALHFNPNSLRAHLGQAELLAEQGRSTEASQRIAAVLVADPDNTDAQFLKGRILEKTGDFPAAEAVYRTLTQIRPNYWRGYNNLGVILQQQAKYDEAIKSFETATHIAPRVAMPIANLGVLYEETGKRQEALEALKKSIGMASNEIALSALGDIAFEEKTYPAAHDYFAEAKNLEPRNHITWADLGDAYKLMREPAEEKRCFTKAADLLSVLLAINPADGPSWMTLGLYTARLGETTRADAAIHNAEELKATDVDSIFIKARAFAALGRTDKAVWLVIYCLDNGLSSSNVNLSVELDKVRQDSRYKAHKDEIK